MKTLQGLRKTPDCLRKRVVLKPRTSKRTNKEEPVWTRRRFKLKQRGYHIYGASDCKAHGMKTECRLRYIIVIVSWELFANSGSC